MPKSIGKQWLPDWVLLGFYLAILLSFAIVVVVIGGLLWGITFLLDVRGHRLRFKAWRQERALKAIGRD